LEKINKEEFLSNFEFMDLISVDSRVVLTGIIADISKETFKVLLDDSGEEVIIDRSLQRFRAEDKGKAVLVLKTRNLYIALGKLYNKPEYIVTPEEEEAEDFVLKKKSVKIDAFKDIEISNGKASVAIKSDGKLVLKGENVSTRARRINRIRGAAIELN
jgi:hypothetical protein